MVVGAGRFHHQLELSRPTALAVGRCVLGASWVSRSKGGFTPPITSLKSPISNFRGIRQPTDSSAALEAIGIHAILSAWFLRIQSWTSLRTCTASLPARSASP